MPTVLRMNGLRVVIYPNDHRPSHVHVMGPGKEAVFNLLCPLGPVSLRESVKFTTGELGSIEDELNLQLGLLCAEWSKIHGDV